MITAGRTSGARGSAFRRGDVGALTVDPGGKAIPDLRRHLAGPIINGA
jgi:hypothetical protein